MDKQNMTGEGSISVHITLHMLLKQSPAACKAFPACKAFWTQRNGK